MPDISDSVQSDRDKSVTCDEKGTPIVNSSRCVASLFQFFHACELGNEKEVKLMFDHQRGGINGKNG